ncbi:hypothetical protein [Tenacibaculum sp. C7A-26P2]|uniref:hypothetical protein n=1 Tax=Tenacibaculum sp. C7A-26P2 TaxID=3447504 RepID=UPI003F83EC0A
MLKDSLLYRNTYCAIEYGIDALGKEQFTALTLLKKKGELYIKNKTITKSVEDLINFLKQEKQQHTILIINNQQVLFKVIEKNAKNPVVAAFPTINKKEFITEVKHSNEKSFIGIVRKRYAENIWTLFNEAGIIILDTVIGNLPVFALLDVLPGTEHIQTTHSQISIINQQVTSITNNVFSEESYQINGLELKNYEILSLGAMVSFYVNEQIQYSTKELETFKQQTIFAKGLKAGLALMFLILLVNFMFFSNYYRQIEKLQAEINIYSETKEALKKIASEVDKKKKLLQQIQNSGTSSLSKYTDQLIQEIPHSILLEEVNYQPFITTIKENKLIKNEQNMLQVSGVFKNNRELSNWIDIVEQKSWVQKVDGLSIESDARKKIAKFFFKIKIK